MYNWLYVSKFNINNPPDDGDINRSDYIKNLYSEYNETLSKNNISRHDFIIKKYFTSLNMDIMKYRVKCTKSTKSIISYSSYPSYLDKGFTLAKNDFPYDVENDIKCYVLWFHPDIKNIDEIINDGNILPELIKDKAESINLKYTDFICFENKPILRSISSVRHLHIFFNV